MTDLQITTATSSELGKVCAVLGVPALVINVEDSTVTWLNLALAGGVISPWVPLFKSLATPVKVLDEFAVALLGDLALEAEDDLTFKLVAVIAQDGRSTRLTLTGLTAIKHQVFEHSPNVTSMTLTVTCKV